MTERPPPALSDAPVPPATVLRPVRRTLDGHAVAVEPLDPRRHVDDLFATADGAPDSLWSFLPYGPFHERTAFESWLIGNAAAADPVFVALVPRDTGRAAGMAGWLNIVPAHRTIEIGHIWFGPDLRRSRAATEAIFLMIEEAFGLGYRRVEWKCNALNNGSRAAAERFGFRFEGLFYRHMIARGRSRDTAWYALVDEEWPRVRPGFLAWLDDGNFDAEGRQRRRLGELIAGARA